MPKTINQGFNTFLSNLTPNITESKAAADHRESIRKCLVSNYKMTNFFRTGSTGNGTSISGYSDTDYFASIPQGNLYEDSDYTLQDIKETLAIRFPLTGVKVDNPAVVCPFGKLNIESTEIVPAFFRNQINGYDVYKIPDSNGGWMDASPLAHNAYVSRINNARNNKVKPLIRLIKAWKYYNNVSLSSFYIEIRIVKYAENEEYIDYPQDIFGVLNLFLSSNLAPIIDPTGISGFIYPCTSEVKRLNTLSKLKTAYLRADKALNAQNGGKIKDAFDWWNLLFNSKFPSDY